MAIKQQYRTIYQDDRWQKLAAKGAKPQRLLWDMTGIANPTDVLYYAEFCIAPETILALSTDMLNTCNNLLQLCWIQNLDLDIELDQSLLKDAVKTDLEPIAAQLLAVEIERSHQAYAQVLQTIEQKQNGMV